MNFETGKKDVLSTQLPKKRAGDNQNYKTSVKLRKRRSYSDTKAEAHASRSENFCSQGKFSREAEISASEGVALVNKTTLKVLNNLHNIALI